MKQSKYNIWVEKDGLHFVYNGVSGGLLSIDGDEYAGLLRYLDADLGHHVSDSTFTNLVQGCMLVSEDQDELVRLEEHYKQSRYQTEHLGLTILTSLGCNFDCPYCFELKHPSILSLDTRYAIINMVEDRLPSLQSFAVDWFGGEPLVGKKALYDLSDRLITLCADNNVSYDASIVTNGYLLDEETCNELQRVNVRHAQVSLDGPPSVHDKMRPLRNGGATFDKILKNLHNTIGRFDVTVRINVDRINITAAEELLRILRDEGLSGKIAVYLGQLTGINDGVPAPSVTYGSRCMSRKEFSVEELLFSGVAAKYGFARASLPSPKGAPCTAVRASDLVIGSEGELYKCYESVGSPGEVIGNIRDYKVLNSNVRKWLEYSPFRNKECRQCIALPVCMGGCPHHAFDLLLYEDRCGTFRHNHRERVSEYIEEYLRSNALLASGPSGEMAHLSSPSLGR